MTIISSFLKATNILTATKVFHSMIDLSSKENFASVKKIMFLGAPSDQKEIDRFQAIHERDIILQDSYGSNEIGYISRTLLTADSYSISTIFPNVKLRVVDVNSGEDIDQPFKQGELFVKAPYVNII